MALLLLATTALAAPDASRLNAEGVKLAEAGRFGEAVPLLRDAHAAAPGDAVILRNLARTEANWGVQLLKSGDAAAAEEAVRRASALLPEDPEIRIALADCLEARGFPVKAAAEIRKAAALGPSIARVRDRYATLLYREGHLEEAVVEWTRAADLEPGRAAIAERLAGARASLAAESPLARQTSAHFEIRFDKERDAVLASNVLQALEIAHGEVGTELQHFGQDRLVIALLPADSFKAVTGTHGWAAGVYDGRIRLLVSADADAEPALLARARHEYVHSVLAPLGNRAPGWLHEGLAQTFEGLSIAQARRRLASAPPVRLDALADSFAGTRSAARAGLQYDTALAFVAWLRDGVRGSAFRMAMGRLFDDGTLATAFRDAYERDVAELYASFQASVVR